jgi:hypothetical protein
VLRILHIANKCIFACGVATIVFAPLAAANATSFNVLYAFQGPDGEQPRGGLISDKSGNLYGMTEFGGSDGWAPFSSLSRMALKACSIPSPLKTMEKMAMRP